MVSFVNRKEMYFFERIYRYISVPVVKMLSKTSITPNMITITNFILAVLNCELLFTHKFNYISACLIILYYFLDVIDGNLARYTGKTSELGARLDEIGDTLFYNLFIIAIGYKNVSLSILIIVFVIHNFYSLMATYYIVPNIRKIKDFKRIGIKKYLMGKGIIMGIDLSFIGVLLVCAIVSGKYTFVYKLIIILYILDTLYRVIELKINKFSDANKR